MDDIRIDRLTLKLSGVTEAEGKRLARRLAEGLARASLPEGAGAAPSAVPIRARVDGSGGMDAATDRAVEAILKRLAAEV